MKIIAGIIGPVLIIGSVIAGGQLFHVYPDAAGFIGGAMAAAFMVFMQWRYGWFPGGSDS